MSFQASRLRVQLPYDGGDEPPAALMQSGALEQRLAGSWS